MKSTKEIADMIGLSKMTVYRYIKANNITETSQEGRTLLYDDTSIKLIIKGLLAKDNETEVTLDSNEEYIEKLEEINEILKTELDTKNEQIEKDVQEIKINRNCHLQIVEIHITKKDTGVR